MDIEFYQLTSAGDREANQDYMAHVLKDRYALFVVADGLGGHYGGEKASRFFCQGLLKCADIYGKRIEKNPVTVFTQWVDAAVIEMRNLFADDIASYQAYTTCAILYMDEDIVLTGHCGDSRVYRMEPQRVLWRTRDHSLPQQLFNEGVITDQEMAKHPGQNKLTRSINALHTSPVEVNIYPGKKKGDSFILCSDGFWGNVKEQELLQLAQPDSSKADLGKLAQLSVLRANGGSDNVTVQWIKCL
ncbi:PP2C family protein-serine/threonine phosphatase [Crenothrix sp.]|jgi:PPM family protein phosphatase|uniref:PP2C family protein-serine/threonine phosphatase n=1 Tax=Crenothrix sp. TaxID=3100433 RepID=UPI00374CA991